MTASTPFDSAPFAASRTKVAVFQVVRGLALIATIFFMVIQPVYVVWFVRISISRMREKRLFNLRSSSQKQHSLPPSSLWLPLISACVPDTASSRGSNSADAKPSRRLNPSTHRFRASAS